MGFIITRAYNSVYKTAMQNDEVLDDGLAQYKMSVPPSPSFLNALVAQTEPGGYWLEFDQVRVLTAERCLSCVNLLDAEWRRAFGQGKDEENGDRLVSMVVPGSTRHDFRLELPQEVAIQLIGADAFISISAQAEVAVMFMLQRVTGTDARVHWHVNPTSMTTIQVPLVSDTDDFGGHLYFVDDCGSAIRARRRAGFMIYYNGNVVRGETCFARGARQYALFAYT